MTSLDAAPSAPAQQGQMTPGAQPGQAVPSTTAAPQTTPQTGGLPPTGLQQQLQSLNDYYSNVQQAQAPGGGVGFDVQQQQFQQGGGAAMPNVQQLQPGASNLESIARDLAERYGLPVGRGRLVDERGNLLVTPDQLAAASGGSETLGTAAAKLNYISQAVTREQNVQQQQKGIGAIQAGLGQVQKRGRGSLAVMMSGMYQDLADLYSNQEYEAADFSYFIQKEQMDIASELQRRQEKLAKKQARGGFLGGVIMSIAGIATGNIPMLGAGVGQATGSAGGTGWF